MSRKQRIAVLIGLGVSVLFLAGAFRNLNLGAVWDEAQNANPLWIMLGVLNYFLAAALISLRWRALINAIQPVPFRGVYKLVCIGYMGNNVYPFRAGEALRVFLLRRNHGVPIVKAATTVIVERVFDGVVMLSFIFVGLLLSDVVSDEIRRVASFTAPIFLLALLTFFVLAARPNFLRRLVARVTGFLPGRVAELVCHLVEEIIAGLEGLRSPVQLAGAVTFSYLSWMVEAVTYWFVAFAFGVEASYPLILLVVGTTNLAGLIPASPGQIGVFEFFSSGVLIAAGVDQALALSYAITVHLVVWSPMTLTGFILLAREGLGWRALQEARALEAQALEQVETGV